MYGMQGPVTVLAKIGSLVLILFGLFWAAVWLIVAIGGAAASNSGILDIPGAGPLDLHAVANVILVFGLVMLVIALLEIVVGVLAWRGGGAARAFGILYALVFGLTSLVIGLGARGDATSGSGGVLFFLIFAIGYLYTAAVFLFVFREKR